MCFTEFITIIISLSAIIVTSAGIYYSRKNAHSNLLLQLIEKESFYMTQWNNTDTPDMMWQYINFMETVALIYNNNEINKTLTKKYFINVFINIYQENNENIKQRVNEGDFEELEILINNWNKNKKPK